MVLYDKIGVTYSATRRTDYRIAAQIWAALGDARTVLNVGAGTGSYEPPDRQVLAVEPSKSEPYATSAPTSTRAGGPPATASCSISKMPISAFGFSSPDHGSYAAAMTNRVVETFTITIERTPEVVFDYLADVSKHTEWSPKPFRVEGAGGPVKTGDTLSTVGTIPGDKDHRNDVTVTECSPPHRLVLDSKEKDERFINTFELEADGAGTRLIRTVDAPKPSFPVSLVFPLIMAFLVRPDVNKGLKNLKNKLEQS